MPWCDCRKIPRHDLFSQGRHGALCVHCGSPPPFVLFYRCADGATFPTKEPHLFENTAVSCGQAGSLCDGSTDDHGCGTCASREQAQLAEREKKAVSESGREDFIKEQAAMLEGVRGEWAALRSALRRAVGAARTLLLTDSVCRLHAVPEDRLEQVWCGMHSISLR